MQDLDDSGLLTTWRAGDQEAFGVLVARYHGLVHAACVRQAAPGDIDDCVQAVFLVLARRPAAAARVPALAAWLQRVASFVCRRSRRAAERRRRAESAAAAEASASTGRPPEALGHLDDCLLRLPEKQRAAVVMHYLAGRSPEEVAASLNTSRENAYQLLSRGLAGLRALLARRGVAVSVAALTGLFAGEAQAAAVPAAPAIVASLIAPPSIGAASLAKGAIAAMTIAAITPFACVAGLILVVATTTVAVTAETKTASPSPSVAPVVAQTTSAAWDAFPADPWLEQQVSMEWRKSDMIQVVDWLNEMAKVLNGNKIQFACDGLEVPVTMVCDRISLKDVVTWIAINSDARITVRSGVIHFVPAGPTPAEPPLAAESPVDAKSSAATAQEVRDRLSSRRLTFDFQGQTGVDVMAFLHRVTGVNIVVHPRCRLGEQQITLKGKEMVFADVLAQVLLQVKGCRMVIRNGAVGILPTDMLPAVGVPGVPVGKQAAPAPETAASAATF